jgi:hypothetical protein
MAAPGTPEEFFADSDLDLALYRRVREAATASAPGVRR